MAASVDTPEQLRTHLAKTGWTFTFLSDPEAKALRSYGLVHEAAEGQVIARPAELLIDDAGHGHGRGPPQVAGREAWTGGAGSQGRP